MHVYLNTSETVLTGMLELSAGYTQTCLLLPNRCGCCSGDWPRLRGVRFPHLPRTAASRSEPHSMPVTHPLGQDPGRQAGESTDSNAIYFVPPCGISSRSVYGPYHL